VKLDQLAVNISLIASFMITAIDFFLHLFWKETFSEIGAGSFIVVFFVSDSDSADHCTFVN